MGTGLENQTPTNICERMGHRSSVNPRVCRDRMAPLQQVQW